jgi:hypothetical protein
MGTRRRRKTRRPSRIRRVSRKRRIGKGRRVLKASGRRSRRSRRSRRTRQTRRKSPMKGGSYFCGQTVCVKWGVPGADGTDCWDHDPGPERRYGGRFIRYVCRLDHSSDEILQAYRKGGGTESAADEDPWAVAGTRCEVPCDKDGESLAAAAAAADA